MAKTTLTFTQNAETQKYEAEYSGESGALQIHRAAKGRLVAYGDAGLGKYDLLANCDTYGKRILTWLDMAGLQKVKLVSDTEVLDACVNEE